MGYKIVQTTEDDEEVLTVVPESWEKNGYLYWPPGRSGYRLRKNEHTFPDETWSKSLCIVKRDKISSFKEALLEEKSMSNFNDTADEENFKNRQQQDRLHPQRKFDHIEDDFNYMLNIEKLPPTMPIVPSFPIVQTLENSKTCEEIKTSTNEPDQNSEIILISDDMGVFTIPSTLPKEVNDPQGVFQTQIEKVLSNQEKLFEQQEIIKKSIAGLHAQFDLLLTTLEKGISSTSANESMGTAVCDEEMASLLQLLPLSNLDQLNELERKLGDKDVQSVFIKHFTSIGGVGGNKNSNRITYMVVDAIFGRQFLVECSWTGSTKTKNDRKIAFMKYKKVIETFYNIIHLADSRYTMDDNNSFFRRLLKNSASRASNKTKTNDTITTEENPRDV